MPDTPSPLLLDALKALRTQSLEVLRIRYWAMAGYNTRLGVAPTPEQLVRWVRAHATEAARAVDLYEQADAELRRLEAAADDAPVEARLRARVVPRE